MNPDSSSSSKRHGNNYAPDTFHRGMYYWDKTRNRSNENQFRNRSPPSHGYAPKRFASADLFTHNRGSPDNRFQRFHHRSDQRFVPFDRDLSKQKSAKFKSKNYRTDGKRAASPVLGSEEYTNRKIKQTSALIMRQLLTPEETIPQVNSTQNDEKQTDTDLPAASKKKTKKQGKADKNKKTSYDIREIHDKIMSHITNLNDGKKKNLINNTVNSCYDEAIQNIQKKKQLEISRALRYMCAAENSVQAIQESSNIIDSIIPDLGIKIEELPRDVIEQLSLTLNCDFEGRGYEDIPDNLSQITSIDLTPAYFEPEIGNITCDSSNSSPMEVNIAIDVPTVKIEQEEIVELNQYADDENNTGIEKVDIKTEVEEPVYEFEYNNAANCIDEVNFEPPDTEIEEVVNDRKENFVIIKTEPEEEVKEAQPAPSSLEIEREQYCNIEESEEKDDTISSSFENPENIIEKRIESIEKSVQTNELVTEGDFLRHLLQYFVSNAPQTLKDKVDRMFWIDDCVSQLTAYRKSLFECYDEITTVDNKETGSEVPTVSQSVSEDKRVLKKRKITKGESQPVTPKVGGNKKDVSDKFVTPKNKQKEVSLGKYGENFVTPKRTIEVNTNSDSVSIKSEEENEVEMEAKGLAFQQNILEFKGIHEKMLVLKLIEDHLIAASESGKIYFCSLEDGSYTRILQVTNTPITSLLFCNIDNTTQMFVGSFDAYLRIYFHNSMSLFKCLYIAEAIQCMEQQWGYIFLGCKAGSLMRYSIKKQKIESDEKILTSSILVLKAAQEGSRRILIVGTRMQSVMIRDAMSGLYMRDLDTTHSPTVYCLLFENNLVYCGTTSDNILVISFHEGKLVHRYMASKSKGISCMKIMGNLLFASCLDGNIYVYDTNTKTYVDAIKGPGGVILSMEVLENQVIVGTMSFEFKAIPIPGYILRKRQLCNK